MYSSHSVSAMRLLDAGSARYMAYCRYVSTRWLERAQTAINRANHRGLTAIIALGVMAIMVSGLYAASLVYPQVLPSPTPQPVAADATPPQAAESDPTVTVPEGTPAATDSPFAGITELAPTPQRTSMTTHVVSDGEVLWEIAEQYHLRPETILWANDIDNPDLLLIGQKLLIPPVDGVLYTVQPSDRLTDVASRYGVDTGAIATSNGMANPDQLIAGEDIFLPGARPLRRSAVSTTAAGDTVTGSGGQQIANAGAPVALPDNINDLLNAGWLQATTATTFFKSAEAGAKQLEQLPAGVPLERLDGFSNGRIQVRDPGDGKTRQPFTGWVAATDLDVGHAPSTRQLPLSYPENTDMTIPQVFAPYRSQLDGSPYAEANCGPTSIGMALASFGISVPAPQLRAEVLDAQHMWGNNVGTVMPALATVVENHGLSTYNMRDPDGSIHQWSVDEVRDQISIGHPVVAQVRYRSLPGRGGALYFGDHYIVLTAVVPDGFLYNDPIDFDGLGWDRVISADRLYTAVDASDRRYAHAAFAVGS